MQYIELLKTHWLFFAINGGIFFVALVALWLIFRLSNRAQLRQLQAAADGERLRMIQSALEKCEALAEQARQIVAHLQRAQAGEHWHVVEKYYNLLTVFVPQQYLAKLQHLCTLTQPASELPTAQRKAAVEALRGHLRCVSLLQRVLQADSLLERLGCEAPPVQDNALAEIQRTYASLMAK